MTNICEAIACPYFRTEANGFGCQKYAVALHCHLIYPSEGISKAGFESSTQYALYQENPDIQGLKIENESYLRGDRQYLNDVKSIKRDRLPIKYPNRIL